MFDFGVDSPVTFNITAPAYNYNLKDPIDKLTNDKVFLSGSLFPINIGVIVRFPEYRLAERLDETLKNGKVITRRNTPLLIERYSDSSIRHKVVSSFVIGDTKIPIFEEDSYVPRSPRIRIQYWPVALDAFSGFLKEEIWGMQSLFLFYELPRKCNIAYLPGQSREMDPFVFTTDSRLSDEEFMKKVVTYLSYDF